MIYERPSIWVRPALVWDANPRDVFSELFASDISCHCLLNCWAAVFWGRVAPLVHGLRRYRRIVESRDTCKPKLLDCGLKCAHADIFNHTLNIISTTSSTAGSLPSFCAAMTLAVMTKITSLLGARIKARLSDLEKSQGWLAGQLKISDEAVSRWIKGDSGPQYSNLLAISRILKCSVGYLVGDQNDDRIAKVVQIMEGLDEAGRDAVLNGVIAVSAVHPKPTKSNRAA